MFRDLNQNPQTHTINITIDGVEEAVPAGYTVASALLAKGYYANRASVISAQPRGPYCMMGVCYECLVEVDGIANRQACMTEVYEGMAICLQEAESEI